MKELVCQEKSQAKDELWRIVDAAACILNIPEGYERLQFLL
jgi:hypothetical protein